MTGPQAGPLPAEVPSSQASPDGPDPFLLWEGNLETLSEGASNTV